MADLPLFPALCGRGSWSALCRFENLTYPSAEYQPLAEALQIGDAIAGPLEPVKPPPGLPMTEAHTLVKPGQRVALYVHTGAWQGWHPCEVLDVDALGCYLRHEDDNYTETIPWMYLKGRYRMELLPEDGVPPSDMNDLSTLDGLQSHFQNLQSKLLEATQTLPSEKVDLLDATLTSRQRAFIAWLASRKSGYCPDIGASEAGLGSSTALHEWLHALGLSTHRSAFAQWCDEQGAISLSELVEFREEVAEALAGVLSPSEITLLLSEVAASEAKFATLHAQAQELACLLEMVLAKMGDDLTNAHSRGSSLHQNGNENPFYQSEEPFQSGCAEKAQVCKHPSPRNSCVMTTSACCVSKRDQELLRLVAGC